LTRIESTPSQDSATAGFSSPRIVRKHNKRRESILKAAAGVFGEMGYHRTSLEDIAEHLDLTRASLYHYFPSKDALLSACLEFGASEAISRLAEVAAESGELTPTDRLRRLIQAQLTIITSDAPELSRLFLSAMDWPEMFREQARGLRDQHDSFFRAAIEDGVKSGDFTCPDPNAARHCLHGAMNYAPVWLKPRSPNFAGNAR